MDTVKLWIYLSKHLRKQHSVNCYNQPYEFILRLEIDL